MEQIQTILEELRGLAVNYTLTPLLKNRIHELHLQIMGYAFKATRCGDCYRDAAILCYNTLKKTLKMADEKKFLLKRGILLQPEFGKGKFFTRLTMTDDDAKAYLKAHPEDVVKFEKYDKAYLESLKHQEEAPTEVNTPVEPVKPTKANKNKK